MNWTNSNVYHENIPFNQWVEVIALIRENSTGEIREHKTVMLLEDGDDFPDTFNWADGNYSCNCNRSIFFGTKSDDLECSYGKFSVNLMNPVDKTIFYKEY